MGQGFEIAGYVVEFGALVARDDGAHERAHRIEITCAVRPTGETHDAFDAHLTAYADWHDGRLGAVPPPTPPFRDALRWPPLALCLADGSRWQLSSSAIGGSGTEDRVVYGFDLDAITDVVVLEFDGRAVARRRLDAASARDSSS